MKDKGKALRNMREVHRQALSRLGDAQREVRDTRNRFLDYAAEIGMDRGKALKLLNE